MEAGDNDSLIDFNNNETHRSRRKVVLKRKNLRNI